MNIAVQEMRRRPGRFGVAICILALLATLLMLLGGLLDGLLQGSTSALAAQRGDVVSFSGQAKKSIPRSRITAEVRARVEQVPGVGPHSMMRLDRGEVFAKRARAAGARLEVANAGGRLEQNLLTCSGSAVAKLGLKAVGDTDEVFVEPAQLERGGLFHREIASH